MKCEALNNSIVVHDNMIHHCCLYVDDDSSCLSCIIKVRYSNLKNNNLFQLTFGEKCNSDCCICRRGLKHKIDNKDKETLQLGIETYIKNKDRIKKICLIGGETFLYKKEILEFLKHVDYDIVEEILLLTNGSIYDKELLDILSNIKTVVIKISIDDIDNHVLRPNCEMEKIQYLVTYCKKVNIKLMISHTISIFNFFNIERNLLYFKDVLDIKLKYVSLCVVTDAKMFSISILPPLVKIRFFKYLEYLKKTFPEVLYIENLEKVFLYNNYSPFIFKELENYMLEYDKLYNTNKFEEVVKNITL